ncbi:efflux RND transporter permease subunit [Rubinisphaera sp. JC750]|uniref:efflux RND transporter permease subunit n=1 Tax=Rubinisphaera sp. JC750 TaxID=2898658 RepID=UPI001F02E63A|nr:efflux RND transporter permease subunit [Rubinisphaera sp. JC750]
MSRYFDSSFGRFADSPALSLPVLVLLTVFATLGHFWPGWTDVFTAAEQQEEVHPGNSRMSRVRDEPERNLPDVDAVSLTDSDAVLVITSPDLFTPDGAAALRKMVEDLEALPYVNDVFWLDRVPVLNLFGLRDSPLPGPRASARQYAEAKQTAVDHPLVGGQLLSDDGETTLLLIKLDWLFVGSDEDVTEGLKEQALVTAAQFPDTEFEILVSGRVPMYVTFVNSQLRNRWMYQAIGHGMTIVMALILFRGLGAVIIVAGAASLGVYWTTGLLYYFDLQDNPFNDIVLPVLLSLIALADGVHLLVEIRRQRASGQTPRLASRRGVTNVGLACMLTSITTAIGFGSLALAHHDIVREFGLACVLGVGLTFLSVITVIPLLCRTPLARKLEKRHGKGVIDRNLGAIQSVITFVMRHPKQISTLGIVSTILLASTALTLRPDERRANALPLDSEVSQAMRHMDDVMGGMEHSEVRIRWPKSLEETDPQILEVVAAVTERLKEEESLGHPISLASFVAALPGGGTLADRMPLVELLPPALKRAFFVPERREAIVDFRVQDLGIAYYGKVFESLEEYLRTVEEENPGFELRLRGSAVSRWRDLYQIVVDLALSLGSASLVIFFVLTVAYRSLRLGLISLIPNFFPLSVTGAYLVWSGQPLELASVCAFTVCLGIAVDDTIHFLTRFQEERQGWPTREAIYRAFTATGTALIMTSIILVIGFASVLFSDLRDQRIFAVMGVLTIGSALFADLFLLPALLLTFLKTDDSTADDSESAANLSDQSPVPADTAT